MRYKGVNNRWGDGGSKELPLPGVDPGGNATNRRVNQKKSTGAIILEPAKKEQPGDPRISVIIPVFNEASNLDKLLGGLLDVMRSLGQTFEVIVVDDGSTDNGAEVLKRLKAFIPELRVVLLRRNFGQSAAMTAGFDYARGQILITMDGDLQNDPQDIPQLIAKLDEGYDVVSGWRNQRRDPFFTRRLPSLIANWLIAKTTGVRLHDYGCTLKAYRREIAKNLRLYGELHRFIPVLSHLYGARIAEVAVTHHPRKAGRSKYGIGRTYRVVLDLILMLFFQKFATRPLQLFGLGGGILLASGVATELYLTWVKLWQGKDIGSRPLLLLGALLIITGVVLAGIGLLAELVVRVYYESSGQRIYTVREVWE